MTDSIRPRRRRIVLAPAPSHPQLTATVLNVQCTEDEEVEWQWTETPLGRYVSGYRIIRTQPQNVPASSGSAAPVDRRA